MLPDQRADAAAFGERSKKPVKLGAFSRHYAFVSAWFRWGASPRESLSLASRKLCFYGDLQLMGTVYYHNITGIACREHEKQQ